MPPTDPNHLVVSFAGVLEKEALAALTALPGSLKNTLKLLQFMQLESSSMGVESALSTAHERVLGGQPCADGLIPFAALEAQAKPGEGWAFFTPCHWAMGREHATLTDPSTLALPEADSRALLADMQPYFLTEGISLTYAAPMRWLARGEVFKTLPTASLDRVMGRNVDPWLAPSKAIKLLQNEMQMLLYTHPINEARTARRLSTVNSFWLSGSGALTDAPAPALPQENRSLAASALAADWAAYAAAWSAMDAGVMAQLVARQQGGQTLRLSLCGERNALTYVSAQPSLLARVKSVLSPRPLISVLSTL
jgi:hypothetical protein